VLERIINYLDTKSLYILAATNSEFLKLVVSINGDKLITICDPSPNHKLDIFNKYKLVIKRVECIYSLSMYGKVKIPGNVFVGSGLRNLTSLNIRCCNQKTITDESFRYLTKLTSLDMRCCDQENITDGAFKYLTKLTGLIIRLCDQKTITGKTLKELINLKELHTEGCNKQTMDNHKLLSIHK
jgi:hypothetical protein